MDSNPRGSIHSDGTSVLCEDSRPFRTPTWLRLQAAGHDVIGESDDAPGCAEALTDAGAEVALLDGLLPSREAWEELRRLAPTTRLVLYSGMPYDWLSTEADAIGADAFLSKDAPPAELAAMIDGLTADPESTGPLHDADDF